MSDITLGEKIRRIRKGLKLNQLEFANILDFKSATAISKYEDNSRIPDKNRLIKIAELGNITLDELLKEEKPYIEPCKMEENQSGIEPPTLKESQAVYKSEFRISDALTMCTRVLESGTSYATALYLNIQHFDRAISAESRISHVEENLQKLTRKFEEFLIKVEPLREENKTLREENNNLRNDVNRLKATYEHPQDESGQTTNSEPAG